ncbi:MAG: DUF6261 family protein [Bacteroidia bacterium]|nr:DUF6261 family protein [Bacteroidia bacterium]
MNKLSTSARTTEVDDTSDRLLVLYKDETALAEDPFLKPLFGEMQTLSDRITEAIKRDRVLSEMEDADAQVETATRSLNAVLKGYRAMPLEQYSTAGKALYAVMEKYKLKILRLNYADQSSNIEALLMDLSAPALRPHIDALPGVSEAVANLRAAQTDFTAKRVAYEKAVALNTQGASASELKKPLLQLINARLVPFLTVSKMVNPDAFTHFADTVAQAIESTNAAVRRRSSKNPDVPAEGEQ